MEQTYWLGRKRASAANARNAASAEARLAHLDLAGRYSVKAAASAALRLEPAQGDEAGAEDYARIAAGAALLGARGGA